MQLSVTIRLVQILFLAVLSNAASASTAESADQDSVRVFSRFIQLSVPGRTLPVPTTMTQDQQGFLWLGTQHGLYRYDGTDVLEFKANPAQSGSLSVSWISALAADPQGWLWVGTRYGGLNRFDPATESFSRVDLPATVDSSSAEITSLVVLTNLVLNALIHGLDGHPAPQIRLQVEDTPSEVMLHFSDNGKGMTEDELKQLFDPFFTTKRHQGGSGLGAHIVYNLVTVRLQGTISVSSQPGQGVHYLLRLPKRVTAEKNRGA